MAIKKTSETAIPVETLEELLESITPVDPAPERSQFMLGKIKDRIRGSAEKRAEESQFLTVEDSADEWIEPFPGNQLKMLRSDLETQSFLVRLLPGTHFPAHYHPKDEETMVLEGTVFYGDLKLDAGDYHLARKGSHHDEVFTEDGCLLFVRAGTEQNN